MAQEEWKATCYCNFFVPGWDNSTVVEAYHDNGDVESVRVIVKKIDPGRLRNPK